MTDPIAKLFALGLGPWCVPLRGKIPVLDSWESLPPATEATVRDWTEAGYNLGFRTGARSGLVVIDDDQPRAGGGSYVPPPTGLVSRSPTGGSHYYYRAPDPCPRNSVSRLAPHVDVRGEGGQVVVPPSVHPVERTAYVWVSTGEPGTFPALPPAVAVKLDMAAALPAAPGYAESALVREVARVRTAAEGTRHDALNRAAFSLGQLVAGGALDVARVRSELISAAAICGLPEQETTRTISDGMRAGAATPRTAPARTVTAPSPPQRGAPAVAPPEVLVPGSHVTEGGEYVEQGHHAFAHRVLAAIDPAALYRRAAVLGEIHDGQFVPTPVNRLRTIIDASVRLTAGKPPKGKGEEPTIVYRPCSRDHAAVVTEYGQIRGAVRDLRHVAAHPVCVGTEFLTARPGWNDDSGVYLTEDSVPEPLPLDEARAVIEDLVADFPFAAPADRQNFFGLLLTPILRPAIDEPAPMHLIGSPMERTGKTKLAEIVLGVTISGRRTPAMQLGDREEEREKRILSVLLRGQSMLHLDNLRDFVDSPALASLLTSSEYQGRLLGSSTAPSIPNGLTVVGTGNNVHATGEIAKRIVPIRLLPATDAPESRTDFRHPNLYAYVSAQRGRVLGALMGIVAAWRAAGRPLHSAGFGGFERWTAVVGGILGVAGYDAWLTNLAEWRGTADDSGSENGALIAAWHEKHGAEWVDAAKIYDLAVELDLYGWLDKGKTERARRTSFGVRVLNRLVNRVMAVPAPAWRDPPPPVRVESQGIGSRRLVRLGAVST